VILGCVIMGKPKDQADALAMLTQLSGKTHQVYSAVSLRGREHSQAVSITEVTFRRLTEREMLDYWCSGEPVDKAGSYAIQGMGGVFVESIKGSFSGVVGLPLFETAELLSKQGIGNFQMSEEILINVTPPETRVAVIENGVLQELIIERTRERV